MSTVPPPVMAVVMCCFVMLVGTALARNTDPDLYGFGRSDNNPFSCPLFGVGASTCATPGQCTECVPRLIAQRVRQACSGQSHTVLLMSNRSVWVAGINAFLGINASPLDSTCQTTLREVVSLQPSVLGGNVVASSVACSLNATVVVLSNGTAVGFGRNVDGALGVLEPHLSIPVRVPVSDSVQQVTAALSSFVFLLADGTVISSGVGSARGRPSVEAALPGTVAVPCVVSVLSTSYYSGMALCSDRRTIYGWGNNDRKQLTADGATTLYESPVLSPFDDVTTQYPMDVTSLSIGSSHAAIVIINGSLLMRGSNDDGQLGLPPFVFELSHPASVSGYYGYPAGIAAASAGLRYTLAATKKRIATSTNPIQYSNLLVAGSNGGCALGTGLSNSVLPGVTTRLTAFDVALFRERIVVALWVNERSRSFVSVLRDRTSSTSMSPSVSVSPSTSPSWSVSKSLVQRPSASPRVSLSRSRQTNSVTQSKTHPVPGTSTITSSVVGSASHTRRITSSHSFTLLAPPLISRAVLFLSRHLIVVEFNIETDRGQERRAVIPRAGVDNLILILGARQSLGSAYLAEWTDNQTLAVSYDPEDGNITVGVATVGIAPRSLIRNLRGDSAPSPAVQSVLLQRPIVETDRAIVVDKEAVSVAVVAAVVTIGCVIIFAGLAVLVFGPVKNRLAGPSIKEQARSAGENIPPTAPDAIPVTYEFHPADEGQVRWSSVDANRRPRSPELPGNLQTPRSRQATTNVPTPERARTPSGTIVPVLPTSSSPGRPPRAAMPLSSLMLYITTPASHEPVHAGTPRNSALTPSWSSRKPV